MVLVDSDGIPRVPPYSGALSRQLSISYTGLLPSTVYLSKLFYYTSSYTLLRVLQPQYACTLVWALSLSLAATQEIDFSFSSYRYLDVSVPCVTSLSRTALLKAVGSPIRISTALCLLTAPRSISSFVTSFIGS